MPESGRGERIELKQVGGLKTDAAPKVKQKQRQAFVKLDPPTCPTSMENSLKSHFEMTQESLGNEICPSSAVHLIQNSKGDPCDLIHKVEEKESSLDLRPVDQPANSSSEDHCCYLKSKYKKKHSSEAILELDEISKSLSTSRKV